MKLLNNERVLIFGCGKYGRLTLKLLRYNKIVIAFIDNDPAKQGSTIEGIPVYGPEAILNIVGWSRVIIAVATYPSIVIQLESMGIKNYVYWEDLYSYQIDCSSRQIMDKHIAEEQSGKYLGRFVKNTWMNHFNSNYLGVAYDRALSAHGRVLDIGCGCGMMLFHWLLLGYDAYGIDCCQWKLDFCHQKINDFNFPSEWKEHFLFGYGENLQYPDSSFDICTSYYVLEHVADWKQCIAEMIRVTKVGGIILINAPDYSNSYEEHYGIDIGVPIYKNVTILRDKLISMHKNMETFDELNFITKDMVDKELENYKDYITIIDLDKQYPSVQREKGQLIYRKNISYIIKK